MNQQKPILIYCYDAYCGWCYGFSPVIKKIADEYADKLQFEILSGGMILPEQPMHIGMIAEYVSKAYHRVEEMTGIQFGNDFLWHINHPDMSDWFLNSEKPAIAMCIFKQELPERIFECATDLQYALNYEGRDLTDDEAYRHLLEKYQLNATDFYQKLHSDEFKKEAYDEFAIIKQWEISGFPAVLLQTADGKLRWIASGFMPYEELQSALDKVLLEYEQRN
jgi:putative protein-disulfide isomerase